MMIVWADTVVVHLQVSCCLSAREKGEKDQLSNPLYIYYLLTGGLVSRYKNESTFKIVIYCCEAALTYRAEAKVQKREDGREYRPAYLDLLLHRKQEDQQQ